MLNLSYLFEYDNDNDLVFLETLIDLMFDYIDDSGMLEDDIIDKELIEFKNKVNDTFKIQIIYKQYNNTYVSGMYVKPNIIEIYIPKDKKYHKNITGKQILRVFLHELSHYFTSKKVPDYLIVKKKNQESKSVINRIENRLKNPPSSNISWNESDLDLVRQFLDYIYQTKELPNFALSFALAFVDNRKNEHIDRFFADNKTIITKNLNTITNWYDVISDDDLRLLFQIQYFTKYIKESKYQRKLIELQKLIKKYYRRLLVFYN